MHTFFLSLTSDVHVSYTREAFEDFGGYADPKDVKRPEKYKSYYYYLLLNIKLNVVKLTCLYMFSVSSFIYLRTFYVIFSFLFNPNCCYLFKRLYHLRRLNIYSGTNYYYYIYLKK